MGRAVFGDYLSFDSGQVGCFVPGNFMLLYDNGGNAAALICFLQLAVLTPEYQCATHETYFLAFMTCLNGRCGSHPSVGLDYFNT